PARKAGHLDPLDPVRTPADQPAVGRDPERAIARLEDVPGRVVRQPFRLADRERLIEAQTDGPGAVRSNPEAPGAILEEGIDDADRSGLALDARPGGGTDAGETAGAADPEGPGCVDAEGSNGASGFDRVTGRQEAPAAVLEAPDPRLVRADPDPAGPIYGESRDPPACEVWQRDPLEGSASFDEQGTLAADPCFSARAVGDHVGAVDRVAVSVGHQLDPARGREAAEAARMKGEQRPPRAIARNG